LPPKAKTANLILKGGQVAKKAKARDLPKEVTRERCNYLIPDDITMHLPLYDEDGQVVSARPQCILVEDHESEQHLFLTRHYDSFHLLFWERDWECGCEEDWCACGLYCEPTREELDGLLGQFFRAQIPSTPEE
jgi:hypothetical protein